MKTKNKLTASEDDVELILRRTAKCSKSKHFCAVWQYVLTVAENLDGGGAEGSAQGVVGVGGGGAGNSCIDDGVLEVIF